MCMKKYLFLDIDGVLNHDQWYEKIHIHPELCPGPFPLECFDPDCVRRVNEILNETGAELVISSSWRTDRILSETFTLVGLPEKYSVTPSFKNTNGIWEEYDCRGEEIQAFLSKHPCENYVILDDINDMLDSQKDHFIWTCNGENHQRIKENDGTGLTEKLKEKAIDILNKK